MAQPVVSYVVNKLGDYLSEKTVLLSGVHDQVQSINRELRRIQCFLQDADSRQKGEERVKQWVKEIRDVAEEAEDAIDSYMLLNQNHQHRGIFGFIKRYSSLHIKWISRYKVCLHIKRIQDRLREIETSRVAFGVTGLGDKSGGAVLRIRRPLLHVDDAEIVGFESDKENIVNLLLNPNMRRNVVSIVGTGGIGKTTLARKAYSSIHVVREFHTRIWLTVSQEYKLSDLLRKIVEKTGIIGGSIEKTEKEELCEYLKEALRHRRYLIVMDDVWRSEVWDQIQEALPDERNGSRVLITTRSLTIAKLADPCAKPYELRFLSDEESLELLLKKAFPDQDVQVCCPLELMDLARSLAKRCGGLPLALVVIGGLLSIKEKEYREWLRILRNLNWNSDGKECQDILALSFEDLPYYLKSCFMYLASFPEDYEISASVLIRLWVAEGFLPLEGNRTVEDFAEDCLEELIQRCLVQVAKRRADRSVKACRVHDLLRELAITEAKENGFLTICDQAASSSPSNVSRRVAFHGRKLNFNKHEMPKLRTLICFIQYVPDVHDTLFKFLRVMDLNGVRGVKHLPQEINRLMHLRYINLMRTMLEKVPSSLADLPYLQTLDVRKTSVKNLPQRLWKVKTLRHVRISDTESIVGPPPFTILNDIQTLGMISCMPSWKKGLPNLKSLRKLKLNNIHDHDGGVLDSLLRTLENLEALTLSGHYIPLEINPRNFRNLCHIQSLCLEGWLRIITWITGNSCHTLPSSL